MIIGLDLTKLEKKKFNTEDSSFKRYNDQDFEIVRELEIGKEIDKSVAPMFLIRFKDNTEISVYSDEILTEESILKILTPEFVKEYRTNEWSNLKYSNL